jgi:ferredoxin
MAQYRVLVDKTVCIGAGICVEVAETVFSFDDEGKAEAPPWVSAPGAKLLDAAKGCPVLAITIIDHETGEQLYP